MRDKAERGHGNYRGQESDQAAVIGRHGPPLTGLLGI
jgi:hypothetical protein